MGRIVVLLSSKGGSGKSTVAFGVATALSSVGKTVLAIDCDEGARCLDTLFGVSSEVVFDISDVLSGNKQQQEVVLKSPKLKGVDIIPSPSASDPIDFVSLSKFLSEVQNSYDYVLVDTKGQLPPERLALLPLEAEFISVVTTDKIAVKNTGVLSAALFERGIKCHLIIDRFTLKNGDGRKNNIDGIIDMCGARLLGIVPEDRAVAKADGRLSFGKAAAAVYRIASRINGEDVPLPRIKSIVN